MTRLVQKLLNRWLIPRSILICLKIGKLHLPLNLKQQKQGQGGKYIFAYLLFRGHNCILSYMYLQALINYYVKCVVYQTSPTNNFAN